MTETILNLTGVDASLTQQYADTFRRSEHLEPEKALLVAILVDAIHEYHKYSRAPDRAGKDRFREAEAWIMESGNDWIFSFDNVCELLGLDPQYVRRGVREAEGRIEKADQPGQGHETRGRAA